MKLSSLGEMLYRHKKPLVLVSRGMRTCCLGKLQGAVASDMTESSEREVLEYSLFILDRRYFSIITASFNTNTTLALVSAQFPQPAVFGSLQLQMCQGNSSSLPSCLTLSRDRNAFERAPVFG